MNPVKNRNIDIGTEFKKKINVNNWNNNNKFAELSVTLERTRTITEWIQQSNQVEKLSHIVQTDDDDNCVQWVKMMRKDRWFFVRCFYSKCKQQNCLSGFKSVQLIWRGVIRFCDVCNWKFAVDKGVFMCSEFGYASLFVLFAWICFSTVTAMRSKKKRWIRSNGIYWKTMKNAKNIQKMIASSHLLPSLLSIMSQMCAYDYANYVSNHFQPNFINSGAEKKRIIH